MKLGKRFEFAIPSTYGVVLWVAASAAITAVCAWVLNQPDLVKYYGLVNVVLYFLAELKKGK